MFLPSQVFSLIDNDRIILKFGGDKGGKTLKTKFGVTIMNTPLSNSVDAFDLIAAVDSEDSYHNLKVGIFDFYRRDLSALFDDNKPLSMLVIIDSDHIPIYCCVHNSEAFDPSIFIEAKYVTLATESADENPLDRFSDYEHSTNDVLMLTNLNRFVRILLIDGIHIHGFCVVNDQDEITKTMLFSKVISVNEWKKCVVKSHKVHSVLSGDIAFICNIVGTQGCSASYPCYMCKVKLSDLRRRNSHVGEPRIMNEISSQATIVQSEKNVTLKKKKAIQNDSVLNFPLFDLQISQIMIPVLHIVLGIVKKMWDNLLKEIQALDGTEKEQVNFKRVMDLICVMIEANKKDLVSKEEDVKLHEESLQNTIDDYHFALQECAFDHENESIKAFKSNINEMKEVVNESKLLAESAAKIIPATNTALDDLMKGVESFSRKKMGKGESIIEGMISEPPINCKHNPYYNQCFNGADAIRLVENMEIILRELSLSYDDELESVQKEVMDGIVARHKDIWKSFKNIVPPLRASRLLSNMEIEELLHDVDQFYLSYVNGSTGTITIKIHILVAHLKHYLVEYGTVGLFAEDNLESIHALFNTFAQLYSAMPGKDRDMSVIKRSYARKITNEVQNSNRKVRKAKRKNEQGNENTIKKKRQGSNAKGKTISAKSVEDVGSTKEKFEQSLCSILIHDQEGKYIEWDETQKENYAAHFNSLDLSLVHCEHCEKLMRDTVVPKSFLPVHNYVCHFELLKKNVC